MVFRLRADRVLSVDYPAMQAAFDLEGKVIESLCETRGDLVIEKEKHVELTQESIAEAKARAKDAYDKAVAGKPLGTPIMKGMRIV